MDDWESLNVLLAGRLIAASSLIGDIEDSQKKQNKLLAPTMVIILNGILRLVGGAPFTLPDTNGLRSLWLTDNCFFLVCRRKGELSKMHIIRSC